jgi:uncharacterized protein (DUF2336 family)
LRILVRLTGFEWLQRLFKQIGGSLEFYMTGSATAQGTNPQGQMHLNQAAKPGRVSADSFRKLTSLLKKPESAPLVLKPFVEVVIAPVVVQAVEALTPTEAPPVIGRPITLVAEGESVEQRALDSATPAIDVVDMALSEIPSLPPEASKSTAPVTLPAEPKAFKHFPEPLLESQITSLRKPRVVQASVAPPPLPSAEEVQRPKVEAPLISQTPEQEAEAAELARSLLDMMAQGSAAGQPQERALAADTLLRMLPRLPLKSRVMLASRLCLMEQPHHLLVAKLITDPEISVSGPLLEESAQLSDEDLLRVLSEQDSNKRRMMARRRKISRPVTTALIETGDPSVLLTIVRNAGAEITAEGFAMLERAASKRHELLAPMCIRADLPVHFAFSLFWLAPPELRRYLLTRFLTDSETLTKILKIARGTQSDDTGGNAQIDPELVKVQLAKAASGDFASAAETLAEMSSLAPETITRILEDRGGEPLMALLKTLGFPRSQVEGLVAALKGGIIDPAKSPEELQSMFDSLSFNKARILLTYWDWSSLGSGPYALVQ